MNENTGRVVKGIWWTFLSNTGAQLITWAITIIIARILTPSDYGLVSLSGIYMLLVTYLNEMGFSSSIIQKKEITLIEVQTLYSISIMFGIVLMFATYYLAIPFSNYFQEPDLVALLRVYSVSLLLSSFKSIQLAILTRNLEFKKISLINFFSRVISITIGLLFAIFGFGVWTLVAQYLSMEFVTLIGAVCFSKIRPIRISYHNIKETMPLIRYGFTLMQTSIFSYFTNQVDSFFIGKMLGKELLGPYKMAFTLADKPFSQIIAVVNKVFFPFFAKMQNNLESVRHYLIKRIRIELSLVMPVFIGIAICSNLLVNLFLGEKWLNVVYPLQAICATAIFRYFSTVIGNLANSLGNANYQRNYVIVLLVIMSLSFYVFLDLWGYWGAVTVWVTIYPVSVIIYSVIVFKKLKISYMLFIRSIYKFIIINCIMAILVVFVDKQFEEISFFRLGILISIGAMIYITMICLLERSIIKEYVKIYRSIRTNV